MKWMLAVAMVGFSLMYVSCQKDDNPVSPSESTEPVFKIVFSMDAKLCIVDSDGKNYRMFPIRNYGPGGAEVSRDGSKIVYVSDGVVSPQIYLLDLATDNITNLTNDSLFHERPKIAPDGKSVIFLTGDWSNNIFSINFETKKLSQLTYAYRCLDPSFSADGSHIVFWMTGGSEGTGLFLMKSDGSDKRLISQIGGVPQLFPDGRKILYQQTTGAYSNGLFSINIDGTGAKFLSNIPYQKHPSISPDGSKIVFTDFINNLEVMMIDAESGEHLQLTKDTTAEFYPTFSPGGNYIYFASWDTTYSESLEIMKSDGSERRFILHNLGSYVNPIAFSIQGKK